MSSILIERVYTRLIKHHFEHDDSMLFLAGPRQVGKTTISRVAASQLSSSPIHYLNWDVNAHQQYILAGALAVADFCALNTARVEKSVIVFDEIHKYPNWKNFLKGFFDLYKEKAHIIVTGSTRLDIYKRGGDSLMGRYFSYNVHPLTVSELSQPEKFILKEPWISQPSPLSTQKFLNLLRFGGFPKPYIQHSSTFSRRWHNTRQQQLFQEDIRSLAQVHDLAQLKILATLLKHQAGQLVNFSVLANKLNSTIPTVQRWITLLAESYYCFLIKPWHKNITRSLLKEPKIFLTDWSEIEDEGARAENFVATHLFKAVQFWSDLGLGDVSLHFIRDKEKNQVDFLVIKNDKPWFLVEVKTSKKQGLSKSLYKFQEQLNLPHAFQVAIDADYVDVDCFKYSTPTIVPAKTFLSQLI